MDNKFLKKRGDMQTNLLFFLLLSYNLDKNIRFFVVKGMWYTK